MKPPDYTATHASEAVTSAQEPAIYEALATEYYDSAAHPTCYNLNRLSRLFIERHLPEPWSGTTVEVGAGDSCVAAILHARGYALNGLYLTDASEGMLRHSQRWIEHGARTSICDARSIARDYKAVSLLVSSLGDPYNDAGFWNQAARIMKPGGRLLFTTPSHEWSTRFRGSDPAASQVAEFILKSGRRLYVPSLVMCLREQITLIENSGFMLASFESLGAEFLSVEEPVSPKIGVFASERSSLVWGFDVVRRIT